MKQKSFIPLATIVIMMLIGVTWYFGYTKFKTLSRPISSSTPSSTSTATSTVVASPTPTQNTNTVTTVSQGTVTGRLCYPSSFTPPGEIVAKELSSGKIYTQNYVGSTAGGALTYSFSLPVGTYHLKYQAHASTKDTTIFTSGYYDECAKTMHTNECTPDSGHINISVSVVENQETKDVNLCDFYYNPTQEAFLNRTF